MEIEAFEIEGIDIIEGVESSSHFSFCPVVLKDEGKILWDEVVGGGAAFSIEEGYITDFEWYLTHNFYTYETLKAMVRDIDEAAALLELDYNNTKLESLKKDFSIFYMCDQNDADYINCDDSAIQKHISVVTDFYRRFTKRITVMMENSKSTTVIAITGP